ncbi:MAG: hypothetical protein AAGB05_06550 [Pseudomonadota bacterium]
MAEISALEERLAAALERLDVALHATPARPVADPEDVARLQAQRDAALGTAESAVAEADSARAEMQSLRAALAAETQAAEQLRERYETVKQQKDTQAEHIRELEATLQATVEKQASDREELDALIAALEPLVQEHSHA